MTHPSLQKAVISDSVLEVVEFSEKYAEQARTIIFKDRPGSQFEQWFRRVSQGPNAIRSPSTNNRLNGRLISWKTGKDFKAENLFFRTVDTSRLLPMALADFRIQWYAHPHTWQWLKEKKQADTDKPEEKFLVLTLTGIVNYLIHLYLIIALNHFIRCLSFW